MNPSFSSAGVFALMVGVVFVAASIVVGDGSIAAMASVWCITSAGLMLLAAVVGD